MTDTIAPNSDVEDTRNSISRMLEKLEDLLTEYGSGWTTDKIREEIRLMRRLMADGRAPRLALVGRRGAGKSSLINAFFGEKVAEVGHETATTGRASWYSYRGELGQLDILDTRGVQEGSDPTEETDAATARESIKAALRQQPADAIIFLVKATEVDAAIDGDLDALADVCDWVRETSGHDIPIVAVPTQCDILEPKKIDLHRPDAFADVDIREKRDRVRAIEADLKKKIARHRKLGDQLAACIGVSSYMSWRDDGSLRTDDRWHIDRLAEYLVDRLPKEAQFEMARLSRVRFIQRRLANRLVTAASVICAGIAATPIPVADIAPLTGAQAIMIVGIGYLSGRDMDTEAAKEFMGVVGVNTGAAFALREVARQLVKLLPGAGSVISAGVAYAGTYALGKAAIAYFIADKDAEAARQVMKQSKDDGREEYQQSPNTP